jgi:hypothetical protein
MQLHNTTDEGFHCIDYDGGLHLNSDVQQECFVGDHKRMMTWLVLTAVFYMIGYPLFCIYVLWHAFKDQSKSVFSVDNQDTPLGLHRRTATYGFMLKDVKPEVYLWRLMQLPVATVIAMVSTYAEDNNTLLFSTGLLFVFVMLATCKYWPMEELNDNVIMFATSFGNALLSVGLLFVAAFTTGDDVEALRENGDPTTAIIYGSVSAAFLLSSIPVLLKYKKMHQTADEDEIHAIGAESKPDMFRMGGFGAGSNRHDTHEEEKKEGTKMERLQALVCAYFGG